MPLLSNTRRGKVVLSELAIQSIHAHIKKNSLDPNLRSSQEPSTAVTPEIRQIVPNDSVGFLSQDQMPEQTASLEDNLHYYGGTDSRESVQDAMDEVMGYLPDSMVGMQDAQLSPDHHSLEHPDQLSRLLTIHGQQILYQKPTQYDIPTEYAVPGVNVPLRRPSNIFQPMDHYEQRFEPSLGPTRIAASPVQYQAPLIHDSYPQAQAFREFGQVSEYSRLPAPTRHVQYDRSLFIERRSIASNDGLAHPAPIRSPYQDAARFVRGQFELYDV